MHSQNLKFFSPKSNLHTSYHSEWGNKSEFHHTTNMMENWGPEIKLHWEF
jgi:hypothetical protein